MVTLSRIAIIPARGGSKRIPHKNVIDFGGKPMIAWTIEAALRSGLFARVVVSTDDPSIADTARAYGAEAPFLRQQAADDYSPISAATVAALDQASAYFGETYGSVVQLMANCPLRTADDISDAVRHFEAGGADFQISCFRYGWMNPWWAVRLDDRGAATRLFPETGMRRSQDLDALFCPTGAIWLARTAPLREAGTFYGPGHLFHPLPWTSAVDIDDGDDLEMARAVFLMRNGPDHA